MKTVLIVDDEVGVRSLVRMTLGDSVRVVEAEDGLQGLALARERKPDVILLDVMMPGLTGFEVCEAIKSDPVLADTTVIMLTAQAQERDRELAANAGADDYFTKPFSPMALLDKLEEVLG